MCMRATTSLALRSIANSCTVEEKQINCNIHDSVSTSFPLVAPRPLLLLSAFANAKAAALTTSNIPKQNARVPGASRDILQE